MSENTPEQPGEAWDELLAQIARLREREAQNEARIQRLIKDNANAWTEGWTAPQERLIAAEARVARLEEALRDLAANFPGNNEMWRSVQDDVKRALTHKEQE